MVYNQRRRGDDAVYHKSDDYRRHQEQRVIAKRLEIIASIWDSPYYRREGYPKPHRLAKYNLVCSCPMCSYEKYRRPIEKRQAALVQSLAWGVAV